MSRRKYIFSLQTEDMPNETTSRITRSHPTLQNPPQQMRPTAAVVAPAATTSAQAQAGATVTTPTTLTSATATTSEMTTAAAATTMAMGTSSATAMVPPVVDTVATGVMTASTSGAATTTTSASGTTNTSVDAGAIIRLPHRIVMKNEYPIFYGRVDGVEVSPTASEWIKKIEERFISDGIHEDTMKIAEAKAAISKTRGNAISMIDGIQMSTWDEWKEIILKFYARGPEGQQPSAMDLMATRWRKGEEYGVFLGRIFNACRMLIAERGTAAGETSAIYLADRVLHRTLPMYGMDDIHRLPESITLKDLYTKGANIYSRLHARGQLLQGEDAGPNSIGVNYMAREEEAVRPKEAARKLERERERESLMRYNEMSVGRDYHRGRVDDGFGGRQNRDTMGRSEAPQRNWERNYQAGWENFGETRGYRSTTGQNRGGSSYGVVRNAGVQCYNCRRYGHFSYECAAGCGECGANGHISRDCHRFRGRGTYRRGGRDYRSEANRVRFVNTMAEGDREFDNEVRELSRKFGDAWYGESDF